MDALRGERESIKLRKITPSPYVNQKVRGEGQDRPSVGDTVWGGGLQGCNLTPEGLLIKEAYGDWVHAKSGNQLHGGIMDYGAWRGWWLDLAVIPSCRYDAPAGKVGRHFVGDLDD